MYGLLRNMALITEKNPADNMSGMWATVITGLVVVFIILALLIAFLYLLGLITKGMDKISDAKKRKAAPPAAAPTAIKASPAVEAAYAQDSEENTDDDEIIAVIAAAIAAYSAEDGKQYVIKKIKRSDKQPRSAWGNAGVRENTRPF